MRVRLSRLVLAAVLLTAVTTGTAAATPASGPAGPSAAGSQRAQAAQRAASTYAALRTYLGTTDGSGLFRERYPAQAGENPYSYEWPYSQVHVAALDLTAVDPSYEAELAERSRGQERYWNAAGGTTGLAGYASYPVAPYGWGGDMFYDDNEWVGLEKAQRYLQTGNRAALARAEEIFDLVVTGWDTDAGHPAPGGVFWTQATWSQDRNTCSTMPAAELGLRLYQITGKRSYLTWAKRFYDWTNRTLQSPSGLYWDHIDLQGTVNTVFWSYNQGVPIGVNVLLYQATHDTAYLREAERVARAAYTHYVTEGRLDDQPVYFNSIFFKNLLLLESATGGRTYQQAMADYADTLWSKKRDPQTGLVRFNADGTTEAIQQAAAAQIYAVLAWPRSKWSTLY